MSRANVGRVRTAVPLGEMRSESRRLRVGGALRARTIARLVQSGFAPQPRTTRRYFR